MKKFVLVAIGGTGMRVAQSFVALAASGFLSDLCNQEEYKLEIRLVDMDIVAGSDKIELEEMIKSVNEAIPSMSVIVDESTAQSRWKAKGIDTMVSLKTQIDDRNTLSDLVREGSLGEAELLAYHSLFGEDDRTMVLRRGCKGRPRIGSLVWAESFDRDWSNSAGFWRTIFCDIGVDDELRVMFAGSVFGGTGASGTPTLAQKFVHACRSEKDVNFLPFASHVALTLMLPYFDIGQDTDVDSGLFSINSKMALKYYESSEALSSVEFAQFIGDDRRQMDKKDEQGNWNRVRLDRRSRADEGQNDPSMPSELMAAIGICRYFANEIPKAAGVARKVYVPLKWTNSDPEQDIPPEEALLMNKFDYFPVMDRTVDGQRIRTIKDYILRLERFALMLNTYYRTSAEKRISWNYRPEVFRTVWRRQKDMRETYESRSDGVGSALAFSESIFRWLEELDHHGLHPLLKIEGDPQRNILHIQEHVKRFADEGSTAFDLLGIPCANVAARMNSARVSPDSATKYFVSSLMECCREVE